MKSLAFTSHGYKLAGNFFPAAKPQKFAFLLIQGWTGHQNVRAAQALADMGFTSMTYDMRGNGDSEGNIAEFSRADFIADAVVAYDYLKQQVASDTAIGVIGSSFGSYTAVLLPEQRSVACLSLRVPASYPDEGFNEPQEAQRASSHDFAEWRQRKLNFNENHAFKALHNFAGKVQIIEAGADDILCHQVADNYVNAVATKEQLDYTVMKGAPHRLANERLVAEYEELLTAWAKRFLQRDTT